MREYKLTDFERRFIERVIQHAQAHSVKSDQLKKILIESHTLSEYEAQRLIDRHKKAYPGLYDYQN